MCAKRHCNWPVWVEQPDQNIDGSQSAEIHNTVHCKWLSDQTGQELVSRSSKVYWHSASLYMRMRVNWQKCSPPGFQGNLSLQACFKRLYQRLRWRSLRLRFTYEVNVLRSCWQALPESRATSYIHLHKTGSWIHVKAMGTATHVRKLQQDSWHPQVPHNPRSVRHDGEADRWNDRLWTQARAW